MNKVLYQCELCNWNVADELFDDSVYSGQRTFGGYNCVVNSHCYNTMYVCTRCLHFKIYMSDVLLKERVLEELVQVYHANIIRKWWLSVLYDIDTTVGRRFLATQFTHARSNNGVFEFCNT